jgi:hypothetical protein
MCSNSTQISSGVKCKPPKPWSISVFKLLGYNIETYSDHILKIRFVLVDTLEYSWICALQNLVSLGDAKIVNFEEHYLAGTQRKEIDYKLLEH